MVRSSVPVYVVDAFTPMPFTGNPAGVVMLEAPNDKPPEPWMQQVAAEMRHAETAFVTKRRDGEYALRWFTPNAEVDLCGHATLAAAHAIWEREPGARETIVFHTRSGQLSCRRVTGERGGIEMDFPSLPVDPVPLPAPPAGLLAALGLRAGHVAYIGKSKFDLLVELKSETDVRELKPNLHQLEAIETRGVIVAAASRGMYDVVSRFFAPRVAVPEDPVTGSAHCVIAPYFSPKLGKQTLTCYQASPRGGIVSTRFEGDRVYLQGQAITVLLGVLTGWK